MRRAGALRRPDQCTRVGVVTDRDDRVPCGLQDLKNLFKDKWMLAIRTLRHGPLRRAETLSTVNSYSIGDNLTDKHTVLHDSIPARTLKKMREQELIVRQSCDMPFPPRVLYSLIPTVFEVVALAEPLIEWTRVRQELLAQTQAHNRRHGADIGDVAGLDAFSSARRRPDRAGGAVG